jgi:PKD repeat protein
MRAIWLAVAIVGAGLVTACKDSGPVDENKAPNANFSASCDFLQCSFHDSSTDDGEIVSWSWNFGTDGSAQRNPIYNYPNAGSFAVTLTVTDDQGATSAITKMANPKERVVSQFSCVNPNNPGQFIACTLKLEAEAGIEVVLNSSDCDAHGNSFQVIQPDQATLTTDGCYEQAGKKITLTGPYAAGTEINAQVIAPLLKNPPTLMVEGSYPTWHLKYEDGADTDFNDLDLTLTALPTGR